MKISRPGETEFVLMLVQFCLKHCNKITGNDLHRLYNHKKCYLDWIYKTAGYYDKDIPLKNKYELPHDYTDKLDIFINNMAECLRNSTIINVVVLEGMIKIKNPLLKYIPDFEAHYNIKLLPANTKANDSIPYIINKKVLVVSPFKELIENQINNGNLYKLHPELAQTTFEIYKFPYLFLNNGPHRDSLETLEFLKDDIKSKHTDFDIAILSCGCYGGFLVDMIHEEIRKDAIYVGGELPLLFGIVGKRHTWAIKDLFNDNTEHLIIGVPDMYKPENYNKIEDGCYW
jgi:hypothetical protein